MLFSVDKSCRIRNRCIIEVMVRLGLILSLLFAPLPPLGLAAGPEESPTASPCCCCPANACQCGCETPASGDQPFDERQAPRFCGCDNTPLSLPSAPVKTPERPELGGIAPVPVVDVCHSPTPEFFGHQPHGPPQALGILATIILLN